MIRKEILILWIHTVINPFQSLGIKDLLSSQRGQQESLD
ncbi:hypothetical protein MGWOODY_Mmi866 [hydrothermal vent metagenome]|uniref:Uncharacterized protein n=1 Tax=hydrothermal vent metagenome TaxID=652676 RepID=A0A160VIN8_9ZZZZ